VNAPAAVDEDQQLHARGPAVFKQRVERRADGAAGVEHVVKQQHMRVIDLKRQERLHAAGHAPFGKIIAVHGRRNDAAFALVMEVGLQAFGQPNPARSDAHQSGVGLQQGGNATAQLRVQGFGIQRQGSGVHESLCCRYC